MPQMNANLNHQFNTNLSRVQPTPIRVFDNNASKIPGIVKLTLGEPDFNVPDVAKKAAIQSINDNDSHYSAGSGTPQLRQPIAISMVKVTFINMFTRMAMRNVILN